MVCIHCGAFNDNSGNFCRGCGRAIAARAQAATGRTAAPPGSDTVAANRKRPGKRAAFVLVIAALCVIGLLSILSSVRPRGIPPGWKLSRDATGSCEVATPADWEIGRDFFLKRERAEALPHTPGRFPPQGLALWGIERGDRKGFPQVPQGKRFQIRTSLVLGDGVCSVWRVKEQVNFTGAEKSTMQQAGKTLRWMR